MSEQNPNVWWDVIEVNLRGTFNFIQYVHLRAVHGGAHSALTCGGYKARPSRT